MLEENYRKLFASLKDSVEWQIQLPATMGDFFGRGGYTASNRFDVRRCPRIRSRHKAVMYFSEALPVFPRPTTPVAIYTNDLSRTGFGCICREQLFPGERVQILLPHCWMEVTIARGRRLGPQCFEAGAFLNAVHLLEGPNFRLPSTATAQAVG